MKLTFLTHPDPPSVFHPSLREEKKNIWAIKKMGFSIIVLLLNVKGNVIDCTISPLYSPKRGEDLSLINQG
jgi:hypothetical protein